MNLAERVLKVLQVNQPHPLTARALAQRVGAQERAVRMAITLLRDRGELVVADAGGGYHLAQSLTEVEQYVGALERQGAALYALAETLEDAAAVRFAC